MTSSFGGIMGSGRVESLFERRFHRIDLRCAGQRERREKEG